MEEEEKIECIICNEDCEEHEVNPTSIGLVCDSCHPTYVRINTKVRKRIRADIESHLNSIKALI